MLYAFQDAAQRAMAPFALAADLGRQLVDAVPVLPSAARRQFKASCSIVNRLAKTYAKPSFGIASASTPAGEVAVHESVVLAKPFCELRHLAKRSGDRGPALLVVAPLSGHHATLLRETVRGLLSEHDVYITDWTDARQVPTSAGRFDLSDYVGYIQQFIRFLGKDVHVVAVCQPCVPVLAAVSLMEQNGEAVVPRSMTLMAGPVDTRISPTEVNRFVQERDLSFFENRLIERVPYPHAGHGRRVYPGFLQLAGFVMMNKARHVRAYEDYYHAVASGDFAGAVKHEQFYDEYNAVLDMPAEYYLETIAKVFLHAELAEGVLELCGQRIELTAIKRAALLTVEGDKDDITGLGQTQVAHSLCTGLPRSKRAQLTLAGAGHYGVFSGSKFRGEALPAITKFVQKHA